jgi:hypothetical protein
MCVCVCVCYVCVSLLLYETLLFPFHSLVRREPLLVVCANGALLL